MPSAFGPDAGTLPRQTVAYNTSEAPGTVIIDTPNTYLYYVLGGGRAIRYGIGVGRDGFTWAGMQSIARKQEWPDWNPPAGDDRAPALPAALHGRRSGQSARRARACISAIRSTASTAPTRRSTIGQRVSSGCIRLTNENVIDLFNRVSVGAKVVVLPDSGHRMPVASAEPRERVSVPVRATQRDARPQPRAAGCIRAPQPAATSEPPRAAAASPATSSRRCSTGASTSFLY